MIVGVVFPLPRTGTSTGTGTGFPKFESYFRKRINNIKSRSEANSNPSPSRFETTLENKLIILNRDLKGD